ncbi:hypothetical protein DICVIV_03146 [Dictyocaulus viviparus]|uniref:Uncharacterized protein n=1 Tax=Dictyocaulus viviparus TaxID=29172 RepID=A0A0D8Y813_DICVI|nr:hypothetical protein DICVIV_03146 [Dictyocaulus viviparus]
MKISCYLVKSSLLVKCGKQLSPMITLIYLMFTIALTTYVICSKPKPKIMTPSMRSVAVLPQNQPNDTKSDNKQV